MGVQEWVAAWFNFRANDLEKAIRGMLEDSPGESKGAGPPPQSTNPFKRFVEWLRSIFSRSKGGKPSLVDELYKHPLVTALSKPGKKPDYIPARTFALALFDMVMTAGVDASIIKNKLAAWKEKLTVENLPGMTEDALQALRGALPELEILVSETWGKPDFLARWRAKVGDIKARFSQQYPQLTSVLDELSQDTMLQSIALGGTELLVQSPRAAQALNSLIAGAEFYAKQAEDVLIAARTNVETWFDDTMDQVSGWYKRRSQVIGIVLGLVFAVVLNADSVTVAATL